MSVRMVSFMSNPNWPSIDTVNWQTWCRHSVSEDLILILRWKPSWTWFRFHTLLHCLSKPISYMWSETYQCIAGTRIPWKEYDKLLELRDVLMIYPRIKTYKLSITRISVRTHRTNISSVAYGQLTCFCCKPTIVSLVLPSKTGRYRLLPSTQCPSKATNVCQSR